MYRNIYSPANSIRVMMMMMMMIGTTVDTYVTLYILCASGVFIVRGTAMKPRIGVYCIICPKS